jgi:hypothetical protein
LKAAFLLSAMREGVSVFSLPWVFDTVRPGQQGSLYNGRFAADAILVSHGLSCRQGNHSGGRRALQRSDEKRPQIRPDLVQPC